MLEISEMKIAVFVFVLAAVCIATVSTQAPGNIKLNLPKPTHRPFTWSGSVLHDNGRPNGVSLTGTWNPPSSGNSFSGHGSWQDGRGFGGGVSGSVGVGRQTSLTFGVDHGRTGTSGNVGVRIRFRRRRNALRDLLLK